MSDRITEKDLEAVALRINKITKSPLDTYKETKGKFTAQIGNYHIDYAYGGATLYRICSEGGSVTNVLSCGHIKKRDLYEKMQAFIRGIEWKK